MTRKTLIKKLITTILTLTFFTYLKPLIPALAQSFDLSINPPLLEVMIKPGKTITKVYKLINQGADAQVYVELVAFDPSDDQGNIKLNLKPTSPESLTWIKWFSFQNADLSLPGGFLLKSGQTQELVLKLRVPETAEEKDYYESLIFKAKNPQGLIGASGSQAMGILATNILLTVSQDGQPPKQGLITEFASQKGYLLPFFNLKLYDSFEPILMVLKVKNTGQSMFKPLGSVKILDPLGKQVEFLTILPQNVLTSSERQLYLFGNDETDIRQPIVWQPKPLNLGKYQAQAILNLSNSDKKIQAETAFIVFPWKISLGLIITLIILSLIVKKLKP